MTPLTDDDLAAVLRQMFTTHETLADPDRAVSLARTPQRRTHPVAAITAGVAAAATVVALSFTVQSWPVDEEHPGTTFASTSNPTAPTTPIDEVAAKAAQDAANQKEAEALAQSNLDLMPMLPGSTRYDQPPVTQLKTAGIGLGGFGNMIIRTAWWLAPTNVSDAKEFFLAQHPEGWRLQVDSAGSGSTEDSGIQFFLDYEPTGTSPTVQSSDLLVLWQATGDGVVVRVDSYVGWRPTRLASSYVGGTATSATLVIRHDDLNKPSDESVTRVEVTGDQLARLTRAYDDLRGVKFGMHGCPAILEVVTRRIVFHTSNGDLVAEDGLGCDPGIVVTRDGTTLDPTLFETQEFRDLLDALSK